MSNSFWNVKLRVAKYINDIFQSSGKKNFIITGSKQVGKSTVAKALLQLFTCDFSICSIAQPRQFVQVAVGEQVVDFAHYVGCGEEMKMSPVVGADEQLCKAVQKAHVGNRIFIDEIGYLEEQTPNYQREIIKLFQNKQVLAVLRKGDFPFLNQLKNRTDTFVLDLDELILPIGVVIMASGKSKRFGANKHLAQLCGKPLIDYTIENALLPCFADRILLTINEQTYLHCKEKIPCRLHDYPLRSQSTALGVQCLEEHQPFGILFLQADQPFLKKESIIAMCQKFSQRPDGILQASVGEQACSPVLFPQSCFQQLKELSGKNGGKGILDAKTNNIFYYPLQEQEGIDIDTPEQLQLYQ